MYTADVEIRHWLNQTYWNHYKVLDMVDGTMQSYINFEKILEILVYWCKYERLPEYAHVRPMYYFQTDGEEA